MAEQPGEQPGVMDQYAEPNPGPSVFHDFHCTHDPCRCAPRLTVWRRVKRLLLALLPAKRHLFNTGASEGEA